MIETVISSPEQPSYKGVIFLPGRSGKVLTSGRFNTMAQALVDAGYHVARFDSWGKDDTRAKTKTIGDVHHEMDYMGAALRAEGCTRIAVVAKSLSGAIALAYPTPMDAMVLWAPGIDMSDPAHYAPNIAKIASVPLYELDRIRPDISHLATTPVALIHGDADKRVLPEYSHSLAQRLENAELITIPGGTHSEPVELVIPQMVGYLDRVL